MTPILCLKVTDEVCQKSIDVLMTVQDADALATQGNQPQQEAATSATLDERPHHEQSLTEHGAATGEEPQENAAQQKAETSETPSEQPHHEQSLTEHGAATGEGQQDNTAQQKAETSATPSEQPHHEPTPAEHGAATGEGQQDNTAQQKAETSATPSEQPHHEPTPAEHGAATDEGHQDNTVQQKAETSATPSEQPHHEPTPADHGAATGQGQQENIVQQKEETSATPSEQLQQEGHQDNTVQQKAETEATPSEQLQQEVHQDKTVQQEAETSATPQTAPSTTTEAEDGRKTVSSRELALENKLAAMQAELTKLRAEQTASKTQTGNHESISDSDVEIVSVIRPSANKRTLAQTQGLVKTEEASPTRKRCKQEPELANIKKEPREAIPTEREERHPTDAPFTVKQEALEEQSELCSTELVACIMLQDNAWRRLVAEKQESTLIRAYSLATVPMELHVLVVQDGSGCVYAGRVVVASTEPVKKLAHIACTEEKKIWGDRIKSGKTVVKWKLSEIDEIDTPVQVKFPTAKFKPRHFFCTREQLGQGFTIDVPPPSLFETPNFFLSLLSPQRRHHLARTARSLHGRTLRVGTACSGTDICVVALKGLIDVMNNVFNAFRQHSAIQLVLFIYILYLYIYVYVYIYIFFFGIHTYIYIYIFIYIYIYIYLYVYVVYRNLKLRFPSACDMCSPWKLMRRRELTSRRLTQMFAICSHVSRSSQRRKDGVLSATNGTP